MSMVRFFEDLRIGQQTALGDYTFTPEAIKSFGKKFDPQRFHVDEQAAIDSHFGGLVASGWHTCAAFMKVYVQYHDTIRATTQLAEGERWPAPGPGTGFRDLRWVRPVHAGDTVSYSMRVQDKIEMKSRPNWGLVINQNEGVNQHGDTVMTFEHHLFVERKP